MKIRLILAIFFGFIILTAIGGYFIYKSFYSPPPPKTAEDVTLKAKSVVNGYTISITNLPTFYNILKNLNIPKSTFYIGNYRNAQIEHVEVILTNIPQNYDITMLNTNTNTIVQSTGQIYIEVNKTLQLPVYIAPEFLQKNSEEELGRRIENALINRLYNLSYPTSNDDLNAYHIFHKKVRSPEKSIFYVEKSQG